jgi:hypothetical protein
MNGQSYDTGHGNEQGDEPGSVENRLSLDPNNDSWKDTVGEWEDGKTYSLTVKVTQISPGEFEVLEATPEAEPNDNAGEEQTEPAPSKSGGYPNPAVENLMASAKR